MIFNYLRLAFILVVPYKTLLNLRGHTKFTNCNVPDEFFNDDVASWKLDTNILECTISVVLTLWNRESKNFYITESLQLVRNILEFTEASSSLVSEYIEWWWVCDLVKCHLHKLRVVGYILWGQLFSIPASFPDAWTISWSPPFNS